jgi:hypothetical protein
MRPKTREVSGSSDLSRSRLDQIIDMKHELVRLACEIGCDWLDGELADLFSNKGRPETESRFTIGLLLKHIYGLSDESVRRPPRSQFTSRGAMAIRLTPSSPPSPASASPSAG